MTALLVIAVAFLLGCINTGYYLVRICTGTDLRRRGTGNLGARNTGRVLGLTGFVTAMLGDMAKAAAAVLLARAAGGGAWLEGCALLAAVVGHIYPVQLSFTGGKGLASAAGGGLLIAPVAVLLSILACIVTLLITREARWGGIAGSMTLPLLVIGAGADTAIVAPIVMMSALLLFKHRPAACIPLTSTVSSR